MPAASSSSCAARLRLGLDQLADAALPDHRGRARAGRLVGEQKLHVLGAGFLAVDAVDRAGLALDAARHLQLVGVVEGGRRACGRALSRNSVTSAVLRAGRVRRAGEDDVVHAGRAHVLVGAFAHHPAQRFDKVRLAAAIRPDNAGQAALDDEIGRLDEGFEAEKAEAGELHARPSARAGERAQLPLSPAASEHAVDDRRHFVNRQCPRIFLSVDEEGRRRVRRRNPLRRAPGPL